MERETAKNNCAVFTIFRYYTYLLVSPMEEQNNNPVRRRQPA
jgi:hypothetical protein